MSKCYTYRKAFISRNMRRSSKGSKRLNGNFNMRCGVGQIIVHFDTFSTLVEHIGDTSREHAHGSTGNIEGLSYLIIGISKDAKRQPQILCKLLLGTHVLAAVIQNISNGREYSHNSG
jgi:hypothetical protein